MGRRRKWGFSWSWRRASGYSAAKGRLSRRLGVPLTKSGRQRKAGSMLGCSVPWLAAGLFALAAAGVAARPDDGSKVWHWPKEKDFRDGPTRLEVGHLIGEAGSPEWEMSLIVWDDKTGAPDRVRGPRFVGVKVADDRSEKLAFEQSPKSPHDLSFKARPGAKAKAVVIQLGPHPDRPDITLVLSAATVRGLTAKTSFFRKAAP